MVTAAICTRNRPEACAAAVRSVLANTFADFELLVIDQSSGDGTAGALAHLAADPRFRLIRSDMHGVSRARNIALEKARGEVVTFTDDDCTVPPDWISVLAENFVPERVAAVFSNVAAGPHDRNSGFIPAYIRRRSALVRTPWKKMTARGMGASMAVRRNAALALGGFDITLGPGALFSSCEEGDFALRALMAGYHVVETVDVTIVHHGFRTWDEGRDLARRDWIGIGAAYSKPVRFGHLSTVPVVLYEFLVKGIWDGVQPVFRLRRPQGLRRAMFFAIGFLRGLQTPVDARTLLFKPKEY